MAASEKMQTRETKLISISTTLFNQLQAGEITRAEYDKQFHALIQKGIEEAEAGKGTIVTDLDAFLESL
jgi:hypothetical protein